MTYLKGVKVRSECVLSVLVQPLAGQTLTKYRGLKLG